MSFIFHHCNRAKQHVKIHPKYEIGSPNDKYEKEADAVADKVMRMPESSSNQGDIIQRKSVQIVQTKCKACELEDKLQMKPSTSRRYFANEDVANSISRSKGQGQFLFNKVQ